jgi:hypothetical protein
MTYLIFIFVFLSIAEFKKKNKANEEIQEKEKRSICDCTYACGKERDKNYTKMYQ